MENTKYNLLKRTPKPLQCIVRACPAIYEATKESSPIYLIVGKRINAEEAGLAHRVGEGEVLIEVPKGLLAEINNK